MILKLSFLDIPVADKKKNINNTARTPVLNNDMEIRTCSYYPASSIPIITTEGKNKGVINQNDNIIDFKLKSYHPIEEGFPETLSASSKMLLSLKIDNLIVKTYDKLRKQMKQKKYIYTNDYKTIIAKIEVLLVNTESNLKNELSHLENTILTQSKSLNILPEFESEKKKYKNIIKKLQYVKVLKKNMGIL